MDNTYVIGWKSKSEPRFGQGKKLFSREEAEALAAELNEDYPAFIHEALNLASSGSEAPVPAAEEVSPASVIIQLPLPTAVAV